MTEYNMNRSNRINNQVYVYYQFIIPTSNGRRISGRFIIKKKYLFYF